MRKRYSADQWAAWFEEFDRSGLSVTEFCSRIDVNHNSFYRWRKKLDSTQSSSTDPFVPVVVRTTGQVVVEFSCGAVLRVDNHVDSLRPVLQTLAELGGGQE